MDELGQPESHEGAMSTVPLKGREVVGRLIVVPALIVLCCVAVFLLFGLLTSQRGVDAKDLDKYMQLLSAPGGNRTLSNFLVGPDKGRWQHALKVSDLVHQIEDSHERTVRVKQLCEIARNSADDEDRIRGFLMMVLTNLEEADAIPTFAATLERDGREAPLFAIMGLAKVGHLPEAQKSLPKVAEVLETHPDGGIRQAAAFTLGTFGRHATSPAVRQQAVDALTACVQRGDAVAPVRWNASIGLAYSGSPAGRKELLTMLDVEYMSRHVESSDQRVQTGQRIRNRIAAVQAAALLNDPELTKALERLAESDPEPPVRVAAQEALGLE